MKGQRRESDRGRGEEEGLMVTEHGPVHHTLFIQLFSACLLPIVAASWKGGRGRGLRESTGRRIGSGEKGGILTDKGKRGKGKNRVPCPILIKFYLSPLCMSFPFRCNRRMFDRQG